MLGLSLSLSVGNRGASQTNSSIHSLSIPIPILIPIPSLHILCTVPHLNHRDFMQPPPAHAPDFTTEDRGLLLSSRVDVRACLPPLDPFPNGGALCIPHPISPLAVLRTPRCRGFALIRRARWETERWRRNDWRDPHGDALQRAQREWRACAEQKRGSETGPASKLHHHSACRIWRVLRLSSCACAIDIS
jgi:hypothetical protein